MYLTQSKVLVLKLVNNNEIPNIEFCFDLIDSGTFEFAKYFNERKLNTQINNKKNPFPMIENLKQKFRLQ